MLMKKCNLREKKKVKETLVVTPFAVALIFINYMYAISRVSADACGAADIKIVNILFKIRNLIIKMKRRGGGVGRNRHLRRGSVYRFRRVRSADFPDNICRVAF